MGSFVKDAGNNTFNIEVEDNEPISYIELITGKVVVADSININNSLISYGWCSAVNVTGYEFFYVKVTSQNFLETDLPEQISVTTPIWFNN